MVKTRKYRPNKTRRHKKRGGSSIFTRINPSRLWNQLSDKYGSSKHSYSIYQKKLEQKKLNNYQHSNDTKLQLIVEDIVSKEIDKKQMNISNYNTYNIMENEKAKIDEIILKTIKPKLFEIPISSDFVIRMILKTTKKLNQFYIKPSVIYTFPEKGKPYSIHELALTTRLNSYEYIIENILKQPATYILAPSSHSISDFIMYMNKWYSIEIENVYNKDKYIDPSIYKHEIDVYEDKIEFYNNMFTILLNTPTQKIIDFIIYMIEYYYNLSEKYFLKKNKTKINNNFFNFYEYQINFYEKNIMTILNTDTEQINKKTMYDFLITKEKYYNDEIKKYNSEINDEPFQFYNKRVKFYISLKLPKITNYGISF